MLPRVIFHTGILLLQELASQCAVPNFLIEDATRIGSQRYCFRPNQIVVVKGMKSRSEPKKSPVAEQRDIKEFCQYKDRSTKAVTQPQWGERRAGKKTKKNLSVGCNARSNQKIFDRSQSKEAILHWQPLFLQLECKLIQPWYEDREHRTPPLLF